MRSEFRGLLGISLVAVLGVVFALGILVGRDNAPPPVVKYERPPTVAWANFEGHGAIVLDCVLANQVAAGPQHDGPTTDFFVEGSYDEVIMGVVDSNGTERILSGSKCGYSVDFSRFPAAP